MKDIAGKVIGGVIGVVVAFAVLVALLPTFTSSIDTLNASMGANDIAGSGLLYLLPFLLIVGVIVIAIYAFVGKKGWGG